MSSVPIRIGFIGAGPRSVGITERLLANLPEIAPDSALEIFLIDPHPAGPGRIWRYQQSPSLMMNSLTEDVTMFADETCTIEGPLVSGPSLAEWCEQVRAGDVAVDLPDERVRNELAAIGPKGFATRRLFSSYLRWYFAFIRSLAPCGTIIHEVSGWVTAVHSNDDSETIAYTDAFGHERSIAADIVVYAVGHTDAEPRPKAEALATFAASRGLTYFPPNYAYECDFSAIAAGEPVFVRGLGLSFIDIVVMLTLDRGGVVTYDPAAPIGERAFYAPSGAEPRIFAGSGRGVPYHAKITSSLHGISNGLATTFFTSQSLKALLDAGSNVDFHRDAWPLIVKELAYWHYRELFTGHAERARATWAEVDTLFHRYPAGDPALDHELRQLVAPDDVFDISALDRPLAGVHATSLASFQDTIAAYIRRDIFLRESEEHSETLALYLATLACYGVVAEWFDHPSWSLASRVEAMPHWWHNFFSYLDSGPPAPRLELLLALVRQGLLSFVGGDIDVSIEHDGYVIRSSHQPETITTRSLVDAFHPPRAIERSANPALRDIVAHQQGKELRLGDSEQSVSTSQLQVDPVTAQVILPDGRTHPRRFAIGDFASGPAAAAFARPRSNARIFRQNDAIARQILRTAQHMHADEPPEPAGTSTNRRIV